MEQSKANQEVRGGRDVLAKGVDQAARREERVAERGDGPADAEQQHAEQPQRETPANRTLALDARRPSAGRPNPGQRDRPEQQEGVNQVSGDRSSAIDRGVVLDQLEEDEPRADQRLRPGKEEREARAESYR